MPGAAVSKPAEKLHVPVYQDMKIAMLRVANEEDVSICAWVRNLIEARLSELGVKRTWPEYNSYGGGRKIRSDKGVIRSAS